MSQDPKIELQIELIPVYRPLDSKQELLQKIYQIYFDEFGADIYHLKGKRKEIITIKQSLSFLLRLLGFTYPDIANFIGIDHSTVMFSVKKFNSLLEIEDDEALHIYNTLLKYVNLEIL